MTPRKGPHRPKSEQEWLEHQAKVSWSALKNSVKDLSPKRVGRMGLRAATERHPLSSTGIAFAAGLVLTVSWPETKSRPVRVSSTPALDPWSTLLETGSDILREVLTPYLQQKLMGAPQPQPVANPSQVNPEK